MGAAKYDKLIRLWVDAEAEFRKVHHQEGDGYEALVQKMMKAKREMIRLGIKLKAIEIKKPSPTYRS